MNLTRVYAILLRHIFLASHQLERFFDVFFFPILSLSLWGFVSNYLTGVNSPSLASFLIGGLVLWTIFERFGSSIGIDFMFDVWEKNIVNILATPISLAEYLSGLVLVSITKVLVSFIGMWLVATLFFNFNFSLYGFSLVAFWVNLLIFAVSLGIFNISMVMRYGHTVGPLTWILPFLLQPFSAVFYPVSVLPDLLQKVAWFLPISHVFEGMRFTLSTGGFATSEFLTAIFLNLIYFILSIGLFAWIFNLVKRQGRLVKL